MGFFMRASKLLLFLMPVMVLVACSSGSPAADGTAAPVPPTADARTTAPAAPAPSATAVPAEQARQGEIAFVASCAACHASNEFTDTAFQRRWRSRTARNLFNMVSATMPEDAPGSLPEERYLEIVAYMLTLNGFPTAPVGTWDVEALGQVGLETLGSR